MLRHLEEKESARIIAVIHPAQRTVVVVRKTRAVFQFFLPDELQRLDDFFGKESVSVDVRAQRFEVIGENDGGIGLCDG